MNSILKMGIPKIILSVSGFLFLISLIAYLVQPPKLNRFLFGADWSLEELQQLFTGELPKSAVDIQYQALATYGLLSFKSSPSDALAFAQRFCYGSLLTGYDPFNSVDTNDNKSGDGYLIQTESSKFYYSHSIHPVNTQLGNRCSDLKRGGLHQLVVYTQDETLYEVKLEISATCMNQNAPHPCDGILVHYSDHGSIKLNTTYAVDAHYAKGDSWEISLKPNKQYKLIVKPKEGQQDQTRHDFQAAIFPSIVTGNEPYCEACWIDTRGSSQDTLEVSFLGSPTGLSIIRLFWMSSDFTYEISVVPNS
ncbi:MAG: hypothetical protein H0X30_09190 [Anaerolineae bacterium]|nr:hypothetical protein [Anaerolineae bacterium]